jgi:hypothetical protein
MYQNGNDICDNKKDEAGFKLHKKVDYAEKKYYKIYTIMVKCFPKIGNLKNQTGIFISKK